MNYNNQLFEKESIQRELQAMREPIQSDHGLERAVQAMLGDPKIKTRKLNPWVLRTATVATAVVAIGVGVSITTPKAYASELHRIAGAVQKYPTKYQKAFLFQGEEKPLLITELWTDRNREKFVQYRDGALDAATVSDGKRVSRYFRGDAAAGIPANASVDVDTTEHFSIESIESMLNSPYFKERSIVKKSGVMLNGKACDYYDFAKGYYRIWVDPATNLPVQREVWSRGDQLWERDIYEYPPQFPDGTFDAPNIQGLPYFDYPAARAKIEGELASSGTTVRVGEFTVTLKAIVKDMQSVTAFFTSNGDQGKFSDERRLPLPGVRFYTGNWREDEVTITKSKDLKNERMFLLPGTSLANLETLKIGVWSKGKFVGYAEFPYKNVIEVPYAGQLFHRPIASEGGVAKATTYK